jgi:polyisoprenoid-binding protein YceI
MNTVNDLTVQSLAGIWNIDASHSSLSFTARHMLITNVKGGFGKFSGAVNLPSNELEKGVAELSIDVSSVNTGVADRDGHLKSPDFFDAALFPEAFFKSTSVEKLSDEHFKLHGELTIRGITKPIILDAELGGVVTDPWGNERMGFTATGKLNRFDYGLKWNALLETGGAVVGADIKLAADLSLVKQKA